MNLQITNKTGDIIICKTNAYDTVISPDSSLEISVPCDSYLKIEHQKPSHLKKRWCGNINYLMVDMHIEYELLFGIPNGKLEVYDREQISSEYDQTYYELFYFDNDLRGVDYYIQGKEKVEKELLKRERNTYILILFLIPLLELLFERIAINGIILFFTKIALGRTYYVIVLSLYILIFIVSGFFETLDYLSKRKKLKRDIYGMFNAPDIARRHR